MWLCPDHGGRLTGAPDVPAARPSRCVYARVVAAEGAGGRQGEVFDAVAEAYDRERPSYPDELIDAACSIAALTAGSRVLEVGSGTGKLTEALAERGLVVDAVDPGANMIAFARKRVRDADTVEFHLGRFEELSLPEQVFDAVFSAAAFHWIDPMVGWAKAARCLRPGGTLGLIMHISCLEQSTAADDEALHEVFQKYWLDQSWHPLRDLATLRAGVEERRENISAVWTWLGHRDLYNAGAAGLFDDVQLTTEPLALELTADGLWALFATTSLYQRLDPSSRDALEAEARAFFEQRGGKIQTSELALLVTARRS
jgi:ubiquinone/menaquinone biosynthesis C-methylase UbiE